jgi:hypothetical protein
MSHGFSRLFGYGVSFLANSFGGLARCERHYSFRMLRFKSLKALKQNTYVVAAFRGDFVVHAPNFLKDFVSHWEVVV